MTAPKTLNEAREQLEAAHTQLTELQSLVAAHDDVLTSMGIVRSVNATGVPFLENPRLNGLLAQNSELEASVATLTADNKTLAEIAASREASIATLTTRIAQLEASTRTVETRARELVGSLGGAPLAVDGSDSAELTADVLRTQLQAEKDPNAQIVIYRKLKAQEAKAKNRLNGN